VKIFLSSTYEDLVEYRAKAAQAIERLGQQGIRMEVFGARPDNATIASLEEIESSDAVLGIYAHRYGYVPSNSTISITEQEFNFAEKKKKPTFCFCVDDDYPWVPKHMESEPGQSKLKAFKNRINTSVVRDTFTTPEDLAYKVAASLGRFLITSKVKAELENIPRRNEVSTDSGRDQVARRAARIQPIISGARVLLVNDFPKEMENVISIMHALGVEVEVVTTSEDAIAVLAQHQFDVVVSDMRRGQTPDEGLRLLNIMRLKGVYLPMILTVGKYEPGRGTPAYAFGITNRVDELLNLLFDAFERTRG
jgi:CheY-like chemotaxis protein